jgi:hypothetical protein
MTYPKRYTTLLNATLTKVFTSIKGKDSVRYPHALKMPPHPHSSKIFYLFHKNKGHDIEDCFMLKKEIERLIFKSYLKQFVKEHVYI